MALEPGQWSYRGLTFGTGTDFHVDHIEGFEGSDVRSSDSDQPRGDGAIRGLDYVAPRTIAVELALIEADTPGGDGSVYEALWASVREAFRTSRETDFDLIFKRASGTPERVIRCRPVQLVRGEDFLSFNRTGRPQVVLRAVDPRIYSTTVKTQNVPVYAASAGGTDFPMDFPLDFIGGTQTELVVINAGSADAYPLVRFYGPISGTCTGVTLTNSTTGSSVAVNTTIASGQILTADMEAVVTGANRLPISLDGASRYGSWTLPRTAFSLAPGSNTLRFQVTGTSTNVACGLTWRDTWMN